MASNYTPKYTWEFKQDSHLLRYYSFVWGLNPLNADFCKLFWSVVLSPIGILLVLPVRKIGGWLGTRIAKWLDARPPKPVKIAPYKPPKPVKVKVVPSWPERILNTVAHFTARPTVRLIATVAFWIVMVACGLFTIGVVTWFVVTNVIKVLLFIAGAAAAITVILILILLIRLHDKHSKPRMGPSKVKIFLTKVGNKIATAIHFLMTGVHAVKTNTCPRIIVHEDPKVKPSPANA